MSVADDKSRINEIFANRYGITDNKKLPRDAFTSRNGNGRWSMITRLPVTDCRACGHYFNNSETVYIAYLPNRFGRRVKMDICGECSDKLSNPWRQFDEPRPCEVCGRPVGIQRSGRHIWRVFCSDLCRGRDTDKRQRQRRLSERQKVCADCGTQFEAKRKDTKYCSPACRQRAHRAREAERENLGQTA